MLPRTLLLTPVALVLLSPVLFPTAHADPAPVRQRILMDADWRFQYGVEPVLEHSTSINSWQWHFGDADAWKETTSGPDIFGGKVGLRRIEPPCRLTLTRNWFQRPTTPRRHGGTRRISPSIPGSNRGLTTPPGKQAPAFSGTI